MDDDAASGALWRRRAFYVPLCLLTGVLLGAALGYAGGFVWGLIQPNTSVIPGPDGTAITVANDDTAVPMVGGPVGAVLCLVAGRLLAAKRWRHSG